MQRIPGIIAALLAGYATYLRVDRDFGASAATMAAVILVIMLVALVAFMIHYWQTIRLYSEGNVLGRVDPLGRRHEIPIESVERVVAVNIAGPYGPAHETWVFVDRGDKGLFTVNPRAWEPEALDALLQRIGQQLHHDDTVRSIRAVAKQYPGVYPRYLTDRRIIAVGSILLILAMSVIIGVSGRGSSPP
jgi:hypothetical protein